MTKTELFELMVQFPEEFDTEELMYRLYLREKIEESEAAIARGEVTTLEDAERQIEEWYK